MNIMLNNSLQFGNGQQFTENSIRSIAESYLRLGLITKMDNIDEIMNLAWTPVLD